MRYQRERHWQEEVITSLSVPYFILHLKHHPLLSTTPYLPVGAGEILDIEAI